MLVLEAGAVRWPRIVARVFLTCTDWRVTAEEPHCLPWKFVVVGDCGGKAHPGALAAIIAATNSQFPGCSHFPPSLREAGKPVLDNVEPLNFVIFQ